MMADRIEKLKTELTTAPPIVAKPKSPVKSLVKPPLADLGALKADSNVTTPPSIGLDNVPTTTYDAAIVKQQVCRRNLKNGR